MDCLTQDLSRHELHQWLLSIITPRPIAWVSTVSAAGVPNLAPFSFSSGVGTNPPTHLFCPANHRDGSKKDTLQNIEATGEYVVNIVPYALREAMNITAGEYDHGISEFPEAGLTAMPSRVVRPPRVQESPIHLECARLQIHHVGEGPGGANVVIGKILAIHVDDGVLRDGRIAADLVDSIARMGGAEYCRTTDRFDLPPPMRR